MILLWKPGLISLSQYSLAHTMAQLSGPPFSFLCDSRQECYVTTKRQWDVDHKMSNWIN